MKKPTTIKGYEKQIEIIKLLLKQKNTPTGKKLLKEKLEILQTELDELKRK